jgi:lipase ATG15
MGTVFLFLGFFSSMRIHFDVTFILSELGSMNDIDVPVDSKNDEEKNGTKTWFKNIQERIPIRGRFVESKDQRILLAKARISEIIGKISRSRTAGRWMWFYGVFAVVALIMMLSAADTDVTTPEGGRPPIVQLADFYYPAQPDLAYPSCEMTKGFTLPGNIASRLGDYAFLAALSYETPNTTQHHLNTWFGNDTIVDEAEFVAHYREETETTANPVYYKLLSIPSIPGYGIVSIRGSQTTWDFLVDAQLWSAAGLVQVVQACIPFGWIWTPILDNLVTGVNFIESAQLKKVSYYRLTTDFINALLEDGYTYDGKAFNTIRITGASLGGGLAIISGAQTNASAIAISGLNGVLSRNTFIPKVTEEQLNTHVFNVIPDRDIIALVGGRSRLFQEIGCRAGKNNLLGCHSMWRSVCEINFQCGSGGRPILCRCVNIFGYPKPLPTGSSNRTFEEACEEEERFLAKEGLT